MSIEGVNGSMVTETGIVKDRCDEGGMLGASCSLREN